LTRIGIFTHDVIGGRSGLLNVDARSIGAFHLGWHRLAGAPTQPTDLQARAVS